MSKRFLALTFSIIMSMVAIAENAMAKEENIQPTEILNLNDLVEGKLAGSFTKDGRVIYFEVIRGEENPIGDPDTPKFAHDIRIMDAHYAPFIVRSSGNKMINPQWSEDQKTAEGIITTDDDRISDFYVSLSLLQRLENSQKTFNKENLEMEALIDCLTAATKEEDFFQDVGLIASMKEGAAKKTTYTYKTEIRKKALDDIKILEHSALRVRIYTDGGTLKFTFVSCNHGACADSSKMSTKCTKEWKRDNVALYVYDNMCDGITSKGEGPFMHSCNTDTSLQYKTAKDGYFSSYYAVVLCQFPLPRAPNCD